MFENEWIAERPRQSFANIPHPYICPRSVEIVELCQAAHMMPRYEKKVAGIYRTDPGQHSETLILGHRARG